MKTQNYNLLDSMIKKSFFFIPENHITYSGQRLTQEQIIWKLCVSTGYGVGYFCQLQKKLGSIKLWSNNGFQSERKKEWKSERPDFFTWTGTQSSKSGVSCCSWAYPVFSGKFKGTPKIIVVLQKMIRCNKNLHSLVKLCKSCFWISPSNRDSTSELKLECCSRILNESCKL